MALSPSQQPRAKVMTQKNPKSVFSLDRQLKTPSFDLHPNLKLNKPLQMEGQRLLSLIDDGMVPAAFFDPQFRGIYEKLKFGNENQTRNPRRIELPQMNAGTIKAFIHEIARILIPSGHLFLWMDKFHLCSDFRSWTGGTELTVVDMITWNKDAYGTRVP